MITTNELAFKLHVSRRQINRLIQKFNIRPLEKKGYGFMYEDSVLEQLKEHVRPVEKDYEYYKSLPGSVTSLAEKYDISEGLVSVIICKHKLPKVKCGRTSLLTEEGMKRFDEIRKRADSFHRKEVKETSVPKDKITITALANELSVQKASLAKWVKNHGFTAEKVGRELYFTKQDANYILEKRKELLAPRTATGCMYKALAVRFGISAKSVSKIVNDYNIPVSTIKGTKIRVLDENGLKRFAEIRNHIKSRKRIEIHAKTEYYKVSVLEGDNWIVKKCSLTKNEAIRLCGEYNRNQKSCRFSTHTNRDRKVFWAA